MSETHRTLVHHRIRPLLLTLALPTILLACSQPTPKGNNAPPSGPPVTGEPGAGTTNPPPGGKFEDQRVASLFAPTDLTFTPDGRMLISSQSGRIRVYQNGSLLPTPALDLSGNVCTNYEWGLLGLTVDPQFASNQFVYAYYTAKKNSNCEQNSSNEPVNRVSRFTMNGNNIDRATEKVLLDNIPAFGGNHNGGDLAFGADGLLYISVGDAFCTTGNRSRCGGDNTNARSRSHLLGKILRINKDGTVPSDNPFVNESGARRCGDPAGLPSGSGPCAETFAWGLRNPFRIAFKPGTNELYINEVGQERWEEINVGQKGADYGWNTREGNCQRDSLTNCGPAPAGMTNPIFTYGRHQSDFANCKSITGGAFIPAGVWPKEYDNTYLFADYVCGKIFHLTQDGAGGFKASTFKTGLGESSAVTLQFGPYNDTQALYYLTYAGGGEVRRISYTTTNRAPQARLSASVTSGAVPLAVTFDASASSDPDGQPLTFTWNFGDGSAAASGAKVTHTYTREGSFTARVTVRDTQGGSAEATVTVNAGNTAPRVEILSPTASELFRVGQTITLSARATDAEDGVLGDHQLTWKVELRHNDDHSHPLLEPTPGNNRTLVAPAPEGLDATERSYVLITLTATDSKGLSTTVTHKLQPRRVNVEFATQPAGLKLTVNGTDFTAPRSFTSWDGYMLHMNAPAQQNLNGRTYAFQKWSIGTNTSQSVATPASGGKFTATYQAR